MAEKRVSLISAYRWRLDVPLVLVASLGLLLAGLSKPVITLKKMYLWKDTYSILSGIELLMHENQWILAFIVFFFSVVFPFTKLAGLLTIWVLPGSDKEREKSLHWLGILGKWSMLDVFVVAITVVIAKIGSIATATPREGIYFFGASIFLAMFATMEIERLVRKHHNRAPAN